MSRQRTEGSSALQERKVIVIEAAKRPEAQKLRVAAYCRVSSDSSDQLNSFMAQTRYYTDLISSNGSWTMADNVLLHGRAFRGPGGGLLGTPLDGGVICHGQ